MCGGELQLEIPVADIIEHHPVAAFVVVVFGRDRQSSTSRASAALVD
jgi:hypothetical protein